MNNDFAGKNLLIIGGTSGMGLETAKLILQRGGKVFVLSTGADITAYGQWPALPSRFDTPAAETGEPTFAKAGTDDSGLEIFAPPASSADDGFALPPYASQGDAAAGDPNWTWWTPKP